MANSTTFLLDATMRIAVGRHNFTKEQREELYGYLDESQSLEFVITKPRQFVKNLKQYQKLISTFEEKFEFYGGDTEQLKKEIGEIREANMAAIPGPVRRLIR